MGVGCIHLLVDIIKEWLREVSCPLTNGSLKASGCNPMILVHQGCNEAARLKFPLASSCDRDVSNTLGRVKTYSKILHMFANCSMYWPKGSFKLLKT